MAVNTHPLGNMHDFTSEEVQQLLHNKFIAVLGDSSEYFAPKLPVEGFGKLAYGSRSNLFLFGLGLVFGGGRPLPEIPKQGTLMFPFPLYSIMELKAACRG